MDQSQLTSDQPGSSENEITRKRSGLDILLGDEYSSKDSLEDESGPVLNEVESYLQDRPLDREESPLVWWKENEHRFPIISQVAKNTLLFQPHLSQLSGYFPQLD